MSHFDFIFIESRDEKMPFTSFAQIFVSLYLKDPEGKILIAPHIMMDKEVDEVIDSMNQNLEAIRRDIKNKLKKHHANRGKHEQEK